MKHLILTISLLFTLLAQAKFVNTGTTVDDFTDESTTTIAAFSDNKTFINEKDMLLILVNHTVKETIIVFMPAMRATGKCMKYRFDKKKVQNKRLKNKSQIVLNIKNLSNLKKSSKLVLRYKRLSKTITATFDLTNFNEVFNAMKK